MPAVHCFVPTAEAGGIGGHVRRLRALLDGLGARGEVFADVVRDGAGVPARHFTEYGRAVAARPDDVLLYHLAIGSPVAAFVRGQPQRKLVDYHNVTPPEFFSAWDPDLADALAAGREELPKLGRVCEAGFADSAYNERELRAAGFGHTAVASVLVDTEAFRSEIDGAHANRLRETKRGADWLFVGRLAPNKAQHELVKAFALYRQAWDGNARLWLVGGEASPRYRTALERLIAGADLGDAVTLTGPVPAGVLAAHFAAADVFVCLSRHEGFCVPLLEAMAWDLPVVARAAAAVPETLGAAGVLVPDPATAATVAAAVARVLSDAGLRDGLVARGRRRVETFSLERSRARWIDALVPVLESDSAVA
jgi:glycosyltransferase involved in cell wall biosynthesis